MWESRLRHIPGNCPPPHSPTHRIFYPSPRRGWKIVQSNDQIFHGQMTQLPVSKFRIICKLVRDCTLAIPTTIIVRIIPYSWSSQLAISAHAIKFWNTLTFSILHFCFRLLPVFPLRRHTTRPDWPGFIIIALKVLPGPRLFRRFNDDR